MEKRTYRRQHWEIFQNQQHLWGFSTIISLSTLPWKRKKDGSDDILGVCQTTDFIFLNGRWPFLCWKDAAHTETAAVDETITISWLHVINVPSLASWPKRSWISHELRNYQALPPSPLCLCVFSSRLSPCAQILSWIQTLTG